MSIRTITALYDTKAAAEAAKKRLSSLEIGTASVDIHDEGSTSSDTIGQAEPGLFGGLKNLFGHHEDAHTYAEGINRGHFLLTAKIDDDKADAAIRVLDETGAVDVDQLQNEWKGAGWTAPAAAPAYAGTRDEAIPIVQEHLVVGKREVDRGGVRVRSYIVETPVSEQVSLREENVSVERRPVDRILTGTEDAFRDRTIEMSETGEEAVVGKQATVKEELTIKKDVSQRTEEINDTVRHTEVEVDRLPGSAADRTDQFGGAPSGAPPPPSPPSRRQPMRTIRLLLALAAGLALGAPAQAGCLGGAVVGGVGGHFAHHPVLGAVGGCVVGHHLAVEKKRRQQVLRERTTTTTVVQRR